MLVYRNVFLANTNIDWYCILWYLLDCDFYWSYGKLTTVSYHHKTRAFYSDTRSSILKDGELESVFDDTVKWYRSDKITALGSGSLSAVLQAFSYYADSQTVDDKHIRANETSASDLLTYFHSSREDLADLIVHHRLFKSRSWFKTKFFWNPVNAWSIDDLDDTSIIAIGSGHECVKFGLDRGIDVLDSFRATAILDSGTGGNLIKIPVCNSKKSEIVGPLKSTNSSEALARMIRIRMQE